MSRATEDCGCGTEPVRTPVATDPPAYQSALTYRVGRHGSFLGTMTAGISADPALSRLTTRDPSDPALALLDSWATVLDVLTFYQERIANEGFLGTAVERRSILELGTLIDYELAPGVSAETYLAFTTDDIPGSPTEVTIPQGAKVLIARAAGTRMALLSSEPLPTAQTTGSSRLDWTPVTCWALRARSSPSTPAVFCVAALVRTATSSRTVVMSSRRSSRLEGMAGDPSRTRRPANGSRAPSRIHGASRIAAVPTSTR